ncbi:uncharacterized protein LOC134649735 [Cydia amplana]|uniref:uncharacterized protein LOC134649735 n=1 Tax=Cydia amplana TaxID=1869771 RepID=UPI002FE6541F
MFVPIVLATVCLASSTVLAAAIDKPFYDVEDAESLFKDFVQEHNKVYNRREYNQRLAIFKKTLITINEQNEKFPDTVFALNHFADLKPHELECYHGFKLPKDINLTNVEITEGLDSAPDSFDWRKQNKVTRVKDQGRCGSCFIFSAVGDIEGQYAIKHGELVAFSEKQALDCLNVGTCQGGYMKRVMQELASKSMKLEKEGDYPPYVAAKGECKNEPSKGIVQCTTGVQKEIMDEEQLKAELANRGPISIESGKKYWIIKNSWGTVFGEAGYSINTMFVPIVLATVCLASSTVLAAYDKPYYDVEDAENLFKDFVQEHKKVYNRREYYERLGIFKETLKDVNERNAKFPDTVFAVNHFADLKPHEREQYHGFKLPSGNRTKAVLPELPEATATELDWRKKDAVTHVKNQGGCGSCYIFSAVGAIEGQYSIKHKQCPALSEGQALDCLDCGTCAGGIMDAVFTELAQKNKKLEKEADYPYEDSKNDCHEDKSKGVALVTDGKEVKISNEEELKKLLSNYGPLAVGLNAADFHTYHKGILEPNLCKGQDIDHGVVLVGYGEENGKQYWLIKNSWGTVWGEEGYVRLRRGVDACKMGTGYTATCNVA